jgi:aspartate/methionine/tyrosine aminotransferase
MFSSRTDWNLSPNTLSQILDEKRKAGEKILDLTQSNPTHCGFVYDPDLLQLLALEWSLLYEPDPKGLLDARLSIAESYDRKSVKVDPNNIFITASTSEAYSYLFRLFCNPGEKALVPKPSYPLFDYLCALNDVVDLHYRLGYDDEWHLESDSLRSRIDESTRLILVVHPNNPTGSFVKIPEQEQIVDTAIRHRLPLVVDEVFSEYPINAGEGYYGSFAGESRGLVCTLGGISKLLGLPQMKLAWIILSGDSAMVRDARSRLEIIADTYLSVGTPVQRALPELFHKGWGVTDQIRARIAANHSALCVATAQSPVSPLKTEGGWSAILRLPGILSDEEWAARLLKETNLLVYPGHFFEIDLDSCIVLSLLPPESAFLQGIKTIVSLVRSVLTR